MYPPHVAAAKMELESLLEEPNWWKNRWLVPLTKPGLPETPQNLWTICQVGVLRKLWMSITINLQFNMTSQSPTDCSTNHLQMNELITNERNHQMKHQHDEPMIEAQILITHNGTNWKNQLRTWKQ